MITETKSQIATAAVEALREEGQIHTLGLMQSLPAGKREVVAALDRADAAFAKEFFSRDRQFLAELRSIHRDIDGAAAMFDKLALRIEARVQQELIEHRRALTTLHRELVAAMQEDGAKCRDTIQTMMRPRG